MIQLKTFKDFVKNEDQAIKEIYQSDYKQILVDMKQNIVDYPNETNFHGNVIEKIIRDWFIFCNKNTYILDKNRNPQRIYSMITSTHGDKADIAFKIDNSMFIGSVKNTHFMKDVNSSLALTKSEFSAAFVDTQNNMTALDKIGIIVSYQKITDLKSIYKSYIENDEFKNFKIIYVDEAIDLDNKYLSQATNYNISIEFMNTYFYQIQSSLKQFNYNCMEIIDNLYDNHTIYNLYPLQEERVKSVAEKFKTNNSVVLAAIPRTGKTIMSAYLLKKMFTDCRGKVCVFQGFVPSIYNQLVEDYRKVFTPDEIVIFQNNGKDFEYNPSKLNLVFISSQYSTDENDIKENVQNIYRLTDSFTYDEAHIGYGTNKQKDIFKYLKKECKILLLSGTPYTRALANFPTIKLGETEILEAISRGKDISYHNLPLLTYIRLDYETNNLTKNNYVPNSISELVSQEIYLDSFLEMLFTMLRKPIDLSERIKKIRELYPNTLLNCNPIQYAKNILMVCNNTQELKKLVQSLKKLQTHSFFKDNLEFKYSISNSKGDDSLDYMDSIEAIETINDFFKTYNNGFKIFLVVRQALVGATLKNCNAVLMMNDIISYNLYDQASRRSCTPQNNALNDIIHFGLVIDPLPNRVSIMLSEYSNFCQLSQATFDMKYLISSLLELKYQSFVQVSEENLLKELEDLYYNKSNISKILNIEELNFTFKDIDDVSLFPDFKEFKSKKIVLNGTSEQNNNFIDKINLINKTNYSQSEKELIIANDRKKQIIQSLYARLGYVLLAMKKEDMKVLLNNPLEEVDNYLNRLHKGKTLYSYYFYGDAFNNFKCYKELMEATEKMIDLNEFNIHLVHLIKIILNNDDTINIDLRKLLMNNGAVKEFGEVFTPDWLANDMLDLIPNDFWQNPKSTLIDNSSGAGIFLLNAKYRFMEGLKPIIPDEIERETYILKSCIYGVELQPNNYMMTINNLDPNHLLENNDNIVNENALTFNYWNNKKFSAVVGNPPYNLPRLKKGDGGAILWDKFVHLAIDSLLDKDGHLVQIHPIGWRQYESNTKLWNKLTSLSMEYIKNISEKDCVKIFSGVAQRLDYYHCVNTPKDTITTIFDNNGKEYHYNLKKYKFLPSEFSDMVYSCLSDKNCLEIISGKDYMQSSIHTEYKVMNSVPMNSIDYYYTNEQPIGYNISKVIFPENGRKGRFLDKEGEYGIGKYCFAISCDKNDIDEFYNFTKSETMNNIIEALRWSVLHCKYKVLSNFDKDFWKNIDNK